jgi:penicillin-binding protein 1C
VPVKNKNIQRLSRVVLFFSLFSIITLLILNNFYPLNLPKNNHLFARVVVDENNRPLRTFADEKGIWRYPITLEQV